MNPAIDQLFRSLDVHPILLDIGASGSPPQIWKDIARHSFYIGFDADERDLPAGHDQSFHRSEVIRKAVTDDAAASQVVFHLTTAPYCSSTLRPNHASLGEYLFSHLFQETRQAVVPAISLSEVMRQLSIERIDWFKTDSQGLDLRLFESLPPDVKKGVLAVDIEPGLIANYEGEDVFSAAHPVLIESGFWLSRLDVRGSIRIRRSTLEGLRASGEQVPEERFSRVLRASPGWCEARYLRSIQSLEQNGAEERDYIVLWTFALLDGQPGFALDLAIAFEHRFGANGAARLLHAQAIAQIQKAMAPPPRRTLRSRVRGRLARVLSPARRD